MKTSAIIYASVLDTITCLRHVKPEDNLTKEQHIFLLSSAKTALAMLQTLQDVSPEEWTPRMSLLVYAAQAMIVSHNKTYNLGLSELLDTLSLIQDRAMEYLKNTTRQETVSPSRN
jgi:hypothetical protein